MTSNPTLMQQITLLFIFLLISSALAAPFKGPPPSQPTQKPFSKIFAFGDSDTDTGNTESTSRSKNTSPYNFLGSNLPYGMTYFHHPTNRYCDGRLTIDFVAETLSLPFLPPYRSGASANGVNFAVAGGTAIEHSFFVKNNLTIDITPESLGTQLEWFNYYLAKEGCNGNDPVKCGALFNDALVWVGSIGVNDYAYSSVSNISTSEIQNLVLSRVTSFLETILKKGAKYVVVHGLSPAGCLPLALYLSQDDKDEFGCLQNSNNQVIKHNTALQAKLEDLRKQFPQSNIIYGDYYNAYFDALKNSVKYGFKQPFEVCCGTGGPPYNVDIFKVCGTPSVKACANPYQYMNWDGVHSTEAVNKVLADMFLQGGYCRPSFQDLLNKKRVAT